jgi:hypothetical protein
MSAPPTSPRAGHSYYRTKELGGSRMCATTTAIVLVRALRRIDKLETDRRRVSRSLSRCTPGSALAGDLIRQRGELDEQIAHWHRIVEKAEAEGFKVWSRSDFTRGDFVQYRDVWYEVLRVNPRSVTVPHVWCGSGRNIVRVGDAEPGWTWTVGYHSGITGRRSAVEIDELLNTQRPEDHEA